MKYINSFNKGKPPDEFISYIKDICLDIKDYGAEIEIRDYSPYYIEITFDFKNTKINKLKDQDILNDIIDVINHILKYTKSEKFNITNIFFMRDRKKGFLGRIEDNREDENESEVESQKRIN